MGEWITSSIRTPLAPADVFVGFTDKEQNDAGLRQRYAKISAWSNTETWLHSLAPSFISDKMPFNALELREWFRLFGEMSKGQRPGNPLPWKSVDEPFNLEKSIELTQDWDYVTGENPSSNGVASARGMAKVSASLFLTPD